MNELQQMFKKNKQTYLLAATKYTIAIQFLNSGLLTTYYVNQLGLDAITISLINTCSTLASIAMYFLFAVHHPRNMMRAMIIASLLLCVKPLVLIGSGFAVSAGTSVLLLLFCIEGCIYEIGLAVKMSCEYSLIPSFFPRGEFGKMSSRCGIIGGVIAIAVSLLSLVMTDLSMDLRYIFYFAIAFFGFLVSALLMFCYKPCNNADEDTEPEIAHSQVSARKKLTEKTRLLLPHFLRNVGDAGFSFFVLISLRKVTMSETGQSLFVAIGSLSLLIGCYVFMRMEKRFRTGTIILWTHILSAVLAILTCYNANEAVFLTLYALYCFSNTIESYAVPTGIIYSVPQADLPFLSSSRMLVGKIAVLLLLTPIAWLIETIPVGIVMMVAGCFYVFSGVIYFSQYKDRYKVR